ncbi:MAG TPA: serine hydrolase domain-containing protein [Longimicrobiaceae bacterium]|nr:serine hydrolase domain-containing protein [Longimicrobiaceae bacterium]
MKPPAPAGRLLMAAVALLTALTAARAQETVARDTAELAAFIDSVITSEMRREGIPGAAFVLVRRGRIVHLRGYGLADVARGRPVDPERTVWRIGSITKTFTATAVMQLADRGRLDLRSDANRYLTRVKLPATYPLPVTVADLLAHTGGLDEIRPGTQAASRAGLLSLPDFLRPRLARVRPPGQVTSYSTYGITLAGALVEEVSGETFERFLARNLWEPLGMGRTSITAVPDSLAADVAVGYELRGGTPEPQGWEWYHTAPASSINSTAADMARYLIAHLEGGGLGGARILSAGAAAEMHRQHATMHPRIPGATLGFWEDYVGEVRVVEHGGNMAGFSAQLTLIPSERDGFFVVSHLEGSQLRDNLRQALLERLYPAARRRRPVPAPPADFAARATAFTGRYGWTTSCHTCQPRSVPVVLEVAADGDALRFAGRRWIEVGPLLFVREDGTGYIAFRTDAAGEVVGMYPGSFWSFERLPEAPPPP